MKRKLGDRPEYLKSLVKEFYTTKSVQAQKEVLANLANFSYNPINYTFLRQLQITDVFLSVLDETDQDLVQFALAGLCNLSADPENKTLIISKGGVKRISRFLDNSAVDIVITAITCLIYLVGPSSINDIANSENIKIVLKHKKSENKRLSNVATIFLEDLCSKEKVSEVSSQNETVI